MNTTEILTRLNAHPEVIEARLWTLAPGKERLYVTARKHNGGRTWNGGVGYRDLYIDLTNRTVVARGDAGATTRKQLAPLLTEMLEMAQTLGDVWMNALELITLIVTAKQGDAIGSQVGNVFDGSLDEANPNALAYILADLERLQSVDWDEVAEAVEDLVAVLEAADIQPRY